MLVRPCDFHSDRKLSITGDRDPLRSSSHCQRGPFQLDYRHPKGRTAHLLACVAYPLRSILLSLFAVFPFVLLRWPLTGSPIACSRPLVLPAVR